jgi:hypothetical protein
MKSMQGMLRASASFQAAQQLALADPRTLYQAPLLSAVAVHFKNRGFISHMVFPEVPIAVDAFKYLEFDSAVAFKRQNTTYGQDASPNQIDIRATKKDGSVVDHALAAMVDEKEARQAGGVVPVKALKVQALTAAMRLDQECEVADMLRSTTVITQNETLSGANKWTDASSDPKKYVLEKSRTLIVAPNTMIVGKVVHDALRLHPKILDAVKYTVGGVEVENDVLARYFGVKRYIVGEAFVDTAAQGQAQSLQFVWGNDAILAHVVEGPVSPLMDQPSVGYIPRVGAPIGSDGVVPPGRDPTWRVYEAPMGPWKGTGGGSTFIKVESSHKVLLTAPQLAYLIKAAA